ncbi:MAG: hypothetical protein U5R48_19900 [Gammaproteobacteria bacterium]|nr:hypothetical protein [Gammaproteobacteria bacterium]
MGNMYGTARELMQLRRGLPGPDGLPAELPWSETSGPVPGTHSLQRRDSRRPGSSP